MIYGFTKQSGGQVRIKSEVGKGTRVCIYLPRHLGDLASEEAPGQSGEAPRAREGETVLVVDDEPTVRMLITDILEELGYCALEAGDGIAALQVLQSDRRIDLLVTDVGLPGGMNGRQVADAGRALRPELRVLFITGYAETSVLPAGSLTRGMQVLAKPFRVDELADRIKGLIEPR
jgi:CheY-like chemotaxis protein